MIKMTILKKISDYIRISKLKSGWVRCSYCGQKLIPEHYYLTIYKNSGSSIPSNAWLHIGCIEKLNNDINELKNDKLFNNEIMINNL